MKIETLSNNAALKYKIHLESQISKTAYDI